MATLRLRSDWALVLACLALYVFAASQVRHSQGSSLALAMEAMARPIHRLVAVLITNFSNLREGLQDARITRAELRRAHEELEELRRLNQLLVAEVASLREANQLVASLPPLFDRVVLARVVARDAVGEHVVTIDRGRRHGVARDAPVLATGGVVGRVDRVGAEVARVQLLSHPQAAAAARVLGTDQEVLLIGGDRPSITGLPAATVLAENTPVLTTGSEGIYPAGLVLGFTGAVTVESVLTQVPVRLAVRSAAPAVVAVLTPVVRERP